MLSMSTQTHEAWVPEWTFGDRLRKVRRDRKITQDEAATALGVNASQVASWETAGNNPRDIVAIAKRCQLAWNVSAEWMLGLDGGGPTGRQGGSKPTAPYVAPVAFLRVA